MQPTPIIAAVARKDLPHYRELPFFVTPRTVAAIHHAPVMSTFSGVAFSAAGMVALVDAEILGGFVAPTLALAEVQGGLLIQILVARD